MTNLYSSVHIEICSVCNMSCLHCYRTINDYPSKNKMIKLEDFFKIINYVRGEELTLQLQGIGEPTLHPNLIDFIRYSKDSKKFKTIFITTNLLTEQSKNFSDYFDNGLSFINVSIDSLKVETLNKTRAKTDASLLLKNLKKVSLSFGDRLQVTTVANHYNISELDCMGELFASLNIRSWIIQPMLDFSTYSFYEGANKKLFDILVTVKNKYETVIPVSIFENKRDVPKCTMPFDTLHINARGYIMPCCLIWDERIKNFGNCFENNSFNLWKSKEFDNFRDKFSSKKSSICKGCSFY